MFEETSQRFSKAKETVTIIQRRLTFNSSATMTSFQRIRNFALGSKLEKDTSIRFFNEGQQVMLQVMNSHTRRRTWTLAHWTILQHGRLRLVATWMGHLFGSKKN